MLINAVIFSPKNIRSVTFAPLCFEAYHYCSTSVSSELKRNKIEFQLLYYLGELEKISFNCISLYFIELLGKLSELFMLNKYLLQTFKVNSLSLYQL